LANSTASFLSVVIPIIKLEVQQVDACAEENIAEISSIPGRQARVE
jgi:hypothetical protein